MTFINHLLLSFGMSYLGSIPPGALNLTIIDVTLRQKMKQAFYFALACGLIEFFQTFIALKFSDYLSLNPKIGCYIQVFVVPVFFGLGIYSLLQKDPPEHQETKEGQSSAFLKGIALSLANPLAIPFWLFWATYFSQKGWLILTDEYIITFAIGVSLGSIATLMTYAFLSNLILSRIKSISKWINEIIGTILIILAIYQSVIVYQNGYFSCIF